jgi:hypothetical protein
MIAFKCDDIIFCENCYLELIKETEFLELIKINTVIVDVENDKKCEDCHNLCSSTESLNAIKKIVKIFEENINENNI